MYIHDFNERMDKALLDIKRKSYNIQYQAQHDIGGVRSFHMPYSEGVNVNTTDRNKDVQRRRFDVKLALITIHSRSEFRRSEFYKNRHLTYESIADNTNIFPRAFLVFVNGKLVDRFTVEPREDITCFHLEKDVVKEGDTVSVVFTPNYKYNVFKNGYNDIKLNKEYMSYNKLLVNNLKDSQTYLSFIRKTVPPDEQTKVNLTSDLFRPLAHSTTNIYLNIFGFRNLSDLITVEKSNLFIRIKRTMPLPWENLLVFEKIKGGEYRLSTDVEIKYFYPDVFQLVPKGDNSKVENYLVYVFYNTELDNHVLKYNEQLEVLSELLNFSAADYGTDKVHPLMRDFIPDPFVYSIKEYDLTGVLDSLTYKINTLKKVLTGDPGMLREYLKYRHYGDDLYQINMKDVDVPSKIRNSTEPDISDPGDAVLFNDTQLVFIFKNEDISKFLSIRFYVDGLMTTYAHKMKKGIYEYYYIPYKYFEDDSMLDVEVFDTFSQVYQLNIMNHNSVKRFEYKDYVFTNDDIFIIRKSDGKFLSQGTDYEVKIKKEDGSYEKLDDHSYSVISDGVFFIDITNPSYLNVDLLMYLQRNDGIYEHLVEKNIFPMKLEFKEYCGPHKEQIRVHKNRRYIPPQLYDVTLPDNYGGITTIDPGIIGYEGDEYVIDFTPIHYNVIYQADSVPVDGFMNMLGTVDKPLSFMWYDFYMNGRKLTSHNIKFVSPFIFIIQNVKSLYNFVIIEKDRTVNTFDLRDIVPEGDIVEKILKLNPEYVDIIKGIDKGNKDLEDSVTGEKVDDKFRQMLIFFQDEYEFEEMRIIHPGTTKIKKEWPPKYDKLFNSENEFIIQPSEHVTGVTAQIVSLHPKR